MRKVTVELTPQECMDVYRVLEVKANIFEVQCRSLGYRIDRTKKTEKLLDLQDDLNECNKRLANYKTLMERFKKI